MSSSQKGGDNTSRFASLLQPLRDLADNWNIDIARELEQYIELLEGATFTVGDGGPRLNFAEGLLLSLPTTHTHTGPAVFSHAVLCPTTHLQRRLSSRVPRLCTARRSSTSTAWCSRRSSTSLRTRSVTQLRRLLLLPLRPAVAATTATLTMRCSRSTTSSRVCVHTHNTFPFFCRACSQLCSDVATFFAGHNNTTNTQ